MEDPADGNRSSSGCLINPYAKHRQNAKGVISARQFHSFH
jgi:hypothetical protein